MKKIIALIILSCTGFAFAAAPSFQPSQPYKGMNLIQLNRELQANMFEFKNRKITLDEAMKRRDEIKNEMARYEAMKHEKKMEEKRTGKLRII